MVVAVLEGARASVAEDVSAAVVGVSAREARLRREIGDCLVAGGLRVVTATPARELEVEALDVLVVQAAANAQTSRRLRSLAGDVPTLPVVCVLPGPAWKQVRTLLRDGATAVVAEEEVDEALVPAVRSAHAGLLTLPSRLRRDIARPVLSAREKQMLAMVVMGFTNAEIARKLFVAESTVKSHLSSAFAKLGVRSRNEAAALILDPSSGFGTGILEISGDRDVIATVGGEAAAPAT